MYQAVMILLLSCKDHFEIFRVALQAHFSFFVLPCFLRCALKIMSEIQNIILTSCVIVRGSTPFYELCEKCGLKGKPFYPGVNL